MKTPELEQLLVVGTEVVDSPTQRSCEHLVIFRMRGYPMNFDADWDDKGNLSEIREELANLSIRQPFAEIPGPQRIRKFHKHMLE